MPSILLRVLTVVVCGVLVDSSCPVAVPEQRKRNVSKEIQEIRTKQCWKLSQNLACTYIVPVWKTEEETYFETECCKGYENVNGTCIPQCDDCGNGKCIKPHECVCMKGYERNLYNGQCDPICNPTCVNGLCVSPNTCECKDGYKRHLTNNFTCEPICEMGCIHGTCGSSNNCTCDPGFILERVLNDTREQCFPLCVHSCIDTDCFCACPSNYEPPSDGSSICRLKCQEPCRNGYCNVPEECECYDGFKKIAPFKCVPECSIECINAVCTAPNICTCRDGYSFKRGSASECIAACDGNDCEGQKGPLCGSGFVVSEETKSCVPLCGKPCVNANCTSPEACECWDGYEKTSDKPYECLPVCHQACPEGACINPGICDLANKSKELHKNGTCHSTSLRLTQQDSITNHIICIALVVLLAGGLITALVLYLRQRKHHYRINRLSDEHSLRESFYVDFKPEE